MLWNVLAAERNYFSHIFDTLFKTLNCFVESTLTNFKRFPHWTERGTWKRQRLSFEVDFFRTGKRSRCMHLKVKYALSGLNLYCNFHTIFFSTFCQHFWCFLYLFSKIYRLIFAFVRILRKVVFSYSSPIHDLDVDLPIFSQDLHKTDKR